MGHGALKQVKQATSELAAYIWRREDEQINPVLDRKNKKKQTKKTTTLYNAVSQVTIVTLMLWRLLSLLDGDGDDCHKVS